MSTLGQRIRTLREHRGLSQGELAEQAGITRAVLSRIETGLTGRPQGRTLRQLASVLDCDIGTLKRTDVDLSTASDDLDAAAMLALRSIYFDTGSGEDVLNALRDWAREEGVRLMNEDRNPAKQVDPNGMIRRLAQILESFDLGT